MHEIPLSSDYWHKLAEQTIFISALLGGFSIAVIVSLLNTKEADRVSINIFRAAIIAAASFLICMFAMTKILLITSPSFPFSVKNSSLSFPRLAGFFTLLSGIISLMTIIALSGWTKSKRLGRFTTIIGIVGLLLILLMMV